MPIPCNSEKARQGLMKNSILIPDSPHSTSLGLMPGKRGTRCVRDLGLYSRSSQSDNCIFQESHALQQGEGYYMYPYMIRLNIQL